MSSFSASELTQAIQQGIQTPKPETPDELGELKHTPRHPDLAKIWRSGGAQRHAWSGSLGLLADKQYLDEALDQARSKVSEFEAHRMHQSALDWATSLFAPVQPTILPLDPLEKASLKSLSGPYLAELTLFALPMLCTSALADEMMMDSTFTGLLRKHHVFDATSTVAFLGRFSLQKALSLSPQILYELSRALREEVVRFWETGETQLSPVAQALLQTWLEEHDLSPLPAVDSEEGVLEETVLLGVRFAICQKDGRPHDVLSERRSITEDAKTLETWHEAATSYIQKSQVHQLLLGEPCTLGKIGLRVLNLATEGRFSMWARQEHQEKIQKLMIMEESEKERVDFQGQTPDQHLSPILSFPSALIFKHLCGLKHQWQGRLMG